MTTVTLWLLISMAGYGGGQVVVIERFVTEQDCEHVRSSLSKQTNAWTRCIQARVAREQK
jgi:hypothetical protein